jgi:hypothetical protein
MFVGGMSQEWEGPVELGPPPAGKQTTNLGKVLSKTMMGRTFRLQLEKDGVADGTYCKMVRVRASSPYTYKLVPAAKKQPDLAKDAG